MLAADVSIALGLLFIVFFGVGLLIYLALTWQVIARRSKASTGPEVAGEKDFGWPEAFLAGVLISFLVLGVVASFLRRSPIRPEEIDLRANFLLTAFLVFLVAAVLKLRGLDIDALGGFSKTSLKRALSTGVVLLLAATPLIILAEAIAQKFFGSGSSRQEIVDLFNASQTIRQRVLIIVLAIVVAPIAEEFIFRFFIYGVMRRYVGVAFGLLFNAALFAAAHNHWPSALPLFALGVCFTLAYEWSGSILVSMSMHALFNSVQLVLLAFPSLPEQ